MHLDIAERLISTGSELTRKMLKTESTELQKRNSFYAPFSEIFEVITRKTLVVVFQRRSKYRRSEL
jgi:hypothetical protein